MADQDVAPAFQNLVAEMGNVSTAMGAQGVNQIYLPLRGNLKGSRNRYSPWKNIQNF